MSGKTQITIAFRQQRGGRPEPASICAQLCIMHLPNYNVYSKAQYDKESVQ